MTTYDQTARHPAATMRARVDRGALAKAGAWAVNYALVLIFLWFGALKFGDYEVSAIAGLMINSPLTSWLLGPLGVAGTAHLIGTYEIATGLLLAARPIMPRLGVIGGAMATICFLVTVSFMFTTPGVVQPGSVNPLALTGLPGQFLLKDVVLLTVSIWVTGASLTESAVRKTSR